MNLHKLILEIKILCIELYYGIRNCKYKIKKYFLYKKLERLGSWNFTKCKAIYKGKPKANYDLYIVDYYKFPHNWGKCDLNILEMRNRGLCKTKYFHIESEALNFLKTLI